MTQGSMIPSPTGTTRVFGIIGFPAAQVQAPQLMNQQFMAHGDNAIMVALEASPENIDAVIQGLKAVDNLGGFLVTVPHKFAVVAHADACSPTVELAGSANALRREADGRWYAENFDGLGFVEGMRQQGFEPRGKHVSLVGAGGAGVAIAAALVQAGIASLSVTDLAIEKAAKLAARLNAHQENVARPSATPFFQGMDLVINATPMGLRPDDPLPFAVDDLAASTVVADIIMKPAETRLLQSAEARGLRTHAGMHMLLPQIEMYRKFFGV